MIPWNSRNVSLEHALESPPAARLACQIRTERRRRQVTVTSRKKHRKSTEHFWSTLCPDTPYLRKHGSSVPVFCGILYISLWTPQRMCTDTLYSLRNPFSVLFLYYSTEFFQWWPWQWPCGEVGWGGVLSVTMVDTAGEEASLSYSHSPGLEMTQLFHPPLQIDANNTEGEWSRAGERRAQGAGHGRAMGAPTAR